MRVLLGLVLVATIAVGCRGKEAAPAPPPSPAAAVIPAPPVEPSTFTRKPASPGGLSTAHPAWLKVEMNHGGSRALWILFDERAGTDTGYDRAWADLNGDGVLTGDEFVETYADRSEDYKVTRGVTRGDVSCQFSPLLLTLTDADRALPIPPPDAVTVTYYRSLRKEYFQITADTTVRAVDACWQYSTFQTVYAWDPHVAAWGLEKPLRLSLYAESLQPRRGRTMVSSLVYSGADGGEVTLHCRRDYQLARLHLRVTDQAGKQVYGGYPALEGFGQGTWVYYQDYVVPVGKGSYRVEATYDGGPLFGVVTSKPGDCCGDWWK